MKNFYFLFAVGLLACAGTREIDIWDDDPGSPVTICFGDDANGKHSSDCLHPLDSLETWTDEIYGFRAPAQMGSSKFIIATPISDTSKNKSEAQKPEPYFHKIDSSIGFNYFRAPHKISDEYKGQQFDVRVTITFPRMTLQQAAELEARVRKLFPEAQEIDFGLEKKIEAPTESFYYDMPDGVPTILFQPQKDLWWMKIDSAGASIFKSFKQQIIF